MQEPQFKTINNIFVGMIVLGLTLPWLTWVIWLLFHGIGIVTALTKSFDANLAVFGGLNAVPFIIFVLRAKYLIKKVGQEVVIPQIRKNGILFLVFDLMVLFIAGEWNAAVDTVPYRIFPYLNLWLLFLIPGAFVALRRKG
jgi:hypothetical protein